MEQAAPVITITPFDGWGYTEAIDGELAPPFKAEITSVGLFLGINIRGWLGNVLGEAAKYRGMTITLAPRNTDWNGVVVVFVRNGDDLIFSGMAITTGLECGWLDNVKRIDAGVVRNRKS